MRELLTDRLRAVKIAIDQARERAQFYHDASAAGTLNADQARTMINQVRFFREQLARVPHTAAVETKAVEEWNYQGGTLGADFVAVETALEALGNWVATRSNILWNGYGLAAAAPWAETVPTFTAGQTSGLRTNLLALIAAIDTFLSNIPD